MHRGLQPGIMDRLRSTGGGEQEGGREELFEGAGLWTRGDGGAKVTSGDVALDNSVGENGVVSSERVANRWRTAINYWAHLEGSYNCSLPVLGCKDRGSTRFSVKQN